MKMEVRAGVVLAALSLSLFSYCCSAATLITPQNILNGTVGGEITFHLSIDPVDQTTDFGTWTFGPKIVVTWTDSKESYTKDYIGRVEVSRATGTLKFNKLFATDSGEYQVSITTAPSNLNLNGRAELKVYEPVSDVKITPKPEHPIENKTFSLTCDASGQVESIHWVKNDQPLSPSGHITLSPDSKTLSFNPVMRSDNGNYTCTASNPASKMSSEVYKLTVNYGPEQVSISGSSDNVTVGAEVNLTCSAVSQPTAIFTWYLKGELIHKEVVYLIKSVKLNNAGNYTCEAFNSVTEEKRSAKMELFVTGSDVTPNGDLSAGAIVGITIGVILSVAIIIALIVIYCCQDQIKAILGWKEGVIKIISEKNEDSPFIREVNGDISFIVLNSKYVHSGKWTLGSKDVVSWNRKSVTYAHEYKGKVELTPTTGTLKFIKLLTTDLGEYKLEMKMGLFRTHHENGTATLKVYDLITPQNPVIGEVNREITFNVLVDPPGEYAHTGNWKLDKKTIVEWKDKRVTYRDEYEGRVKLTTATGTLKFNKLLAGDSGKYTVTVTMGPTSLILNRTIELKVFECISAFKLTSDPEQPVETYKFSLKYDTSEHVDSALWIKNQELLLSCNRITMSKTKKQLTFHPVLPLDNGVYQCIAFSSARTMISNNKYKMDVINLITPQNPVIGEVNKEVTFNVSVDPPGEYAHTGMWTYDQKSIVKWEGKRVTYTDKYQGRVKLTPATGTLKFNKLLTGDSGKYTVTVTTGPPSLSLIRTVELKVFGKRKPA
ncbi:hemicentin-1-like isoform X3 [Erpetoichthys calabaricus]|uniref:hemicentin-1-like isoform X3 n=1 Tax=Erpetoichthys calabaricus TaxID=27687 RepID=UPI0022341689|nr:hemicentin-1-like isoform X3 [Erpetoichthys calabaricus]